MVTTDKTLKEELTALTGKIFVGDPTAIVFELLSTTSDKVSLLAFLTGGKPDVSNNKPCTTVREKSSDRFSFAEWLSGCEEL